MRFLHRMRVALLFLFFLFGIVLRVGALEDAQLVELMFLPPDFFVGDRVELRAVVTLRPGLRILPPEELPVLGWIDLHDTVVEQDGGKWEIRIEFTPFAPGTRAFPEIRLGDISLSGIKVNVKSILQEQNLDFFGIKNQLLLPGTRLGIGLLTVVLFFGPVLILTFVGNASRGIKRFISVHAGRRPYKRLHRVLRELRDKQAHMGSRKFYILLSEEFRRYLSARTGRDFLTITSSEVPDLLQEVFPSGKTNGVEEMIRQSDLIKFGGINAGRKQREEDLGMVEEMAEGLEEHIEKQRREIDRRGRGRKKNRRSVKKA